MKLGYSPMILSLICIAIFGTFVGLVMYLGYSGERKVHSRLVLANTNVVLVGTFSGQYMLKPFDPTTRRVLPGAVSLQAPDGQLNLVATEIDLLPAKGD